MSIKRSSDIRAVTTHLATFDRVITTMTLDAGKCVVLIFSTGGYSMYTPKAGITILSESEARDKAELFWFGQLFETVLKDIHASQSI